MVRRIRKLDRRMFLKLFGATAAGVAAGASGMSALRQATPTGRASTGETCVRANEEFETINITSDRTFRVEDGETFSNKLIKAGKNRVEIFGRGSGWEIRNIGIIGDGHQAAIKPAVIGDPEGSGLVENVYIENITNNFNFVHRLHEGHVTFRRCAFINNDNPPENKEDGIYASPPGNPGPPAKSNIGYAGTVDVIDCYFERAQAFGVRMGSPGSRCINTTVVGDTGTALANLYGGNFDGYKGNHRDEPPYVLFKDCDVGGGIERGLRLPAHQEYKREGMDYTVAVRLENVSIDAETPIKAYPTAAGPPLINGEEITDESPDINEIDGVDDNPDLSPPAGVPMSPEEAASGGYVNCPSGSDFNSGGSGTGDGGGSGSGTGSGSGSGSSGPSIPAACLKYFRSG